ncbi:MAG: hypothetical protein HC802_14700 [Caldilineaceae bacterium]|nr:hypothetical protein [Caldilineaceae bacterium]
MDESSHSAQNQRSQHDPEPLRIPITVDGVATAQGGPRSSASQPKRGGLFNWSGPWVLIVGFAAIILVGTLLLKLPWSAAEGRSISWADALFTSTSATTVTGLVVLNTARDFSFFGQLVILFLLQVGGVGFIAFSVLLFRLIGRRVNLQTRFIVQQSLGAEKRSGVVELALYVLGVTVTLEAIGALLLWLRWRTVMSDADAIWYAIFHAISSYCNAGFDLFSGTERGTLFGFGSDWYTLAVMGTLIVLGAWHHGHVRPVELPFGPSTRPEHPADPGLGRTLDRDRSGHSAGGSGVSWQSGQPVALG